VVTLSGRWERRIGIEDYLTWQRSKNKEKNKKENKRDKAVIGRRRRLETTIEANRKIIENGKAKEDKIDTFILSEENKRDEDYHDESYEHTPPDITNKIKQVHFISHVSQIEIALNEILNNSVKEKEHVCGKEPIPDRKPEKPNQRDPPTSEITSEQLLALITELSIREKQGENQDFWEKLQMAYGKNAKYLEAVNQAKNLREEYVGKLEKLQKPGERNGNKQEQIKKLQGEIENLKKERDQLNNSLNHLHSVLPANGAPVSRERTGRVKEMYNEYIRFRTHDNWKFWILGLIFKPLFESFNSTVSVASMEELSRTAILWVDQHCSLIEMRPAVSNQLRYLSTTTDILSNPPSTLQEEVLKAIS